MYCQKCGKPIPDNSTFCNVCGAPQGQMQPTQPTTQQQAKKLPTYYYVDSWLLFGLCMAYGAIRFMIGVFTADEISIYKGLIACGAACLFIPNITVGVKSPGGILAIKILAAAAVMIFI